VLPDVKIGWNAESCIMFHFEEDVMSGRAR